MKFLCKYIAIFIINYEAGFVYGKSFLNITVEIPKNVVSGSSVPFHCFFDYPIQKIDSVKWYRQRAEFFRYTPSEYPPAKTLHVCKECDVDLAASNATQIMMQNVSEALSGEFTCEVTIANTYESAPTSGILYVYDAKLLSKPKIKLENRIFNGLEFPTFLCSTVFIKEKNIFSNFFFVNNERFASTGCKIEIDPTLATYDQKNGYFRLYIDPTPWRNDTNVNISCRSTLPGTEGLVSDEICYNCLPNKSPRFLSGMNFICSISISLLWTRLELPL